MAVKYLSNKVKDLQVGITNYSENKGSSLYVVGNVGVGTNDATAEVGISNTSVLAVGILTAYRIFSSVYGEFQGGSVSADNITGVALSVSGITTLSTVKISGGIVTSTTNSGIVTYYGDGSNLTGVGGIGSLDQLTVSGLSTFTGLIRSDGGAYLAGITTALNFTANTAKVTDLTDNRVVIAGSNGELEDDANLTYDGTVLSVGTGLTVTGVSTFAGAIDANGDLDVDGHTELDDVNVTGVTTFNQDVKFPGAAYNIHWDQPTSKFKFDDSAQLVFGSASGGDLRIWHASDVSNIKNETGQFRIAGNDIRLQTQNNSADYLLAVDGGSVSIFHNNVKRLETTDSGVNITDTLNVTGVSTFAGTVDVNGYLDVGGQARINGITTFYNTLASNFSTHGSVVMHGGLGVSQMSNFGDGLNVIGHTEVDNLNVSGVSTFAGNINANGDIIGDGQTNISGISSLTVANRIAHTNDTSTSVAFGVGVISLIADGNTRLSVIDSVTQISGGLNVTVGDSAGIATFAGNIDANADLDVDGHTELDDVNVSGIATFNNNVWLGTQGVDQIHVGGRFTSHLLSMSGGYNLGSSTEGWQNLFLAGNAGIGSLSVTGISTLGTVQVSSGIITATSGVVTYFGDGSNLTGTGSGGINTTGTSEFTNLNVSGVSTFAGAIDANGDLDVDGHTELDHVNIAGVATFGGNTINIATWISHNGDLDTRFGFYGPDELTFETGGTERVHINSSGLQVTNGAGLHVTGVSTLGGNIFLGNDGSDQINIGGYFISDLNPLGNNQYDLGTSGKYWKNVFISDTVVTNQINASGVSTFAGLVASTAKISDLTDNRIVIAGTAGELEDTTKLTFDGTTLAVVGDATFSGNVSIAGTLTKEDVTNIDSVGLVTAQTGVRVTAGGLVVSSGVSTFTDAIDVNGGADISGGTGLTASSVKVSDLTVNRVVTVGASGELQDSANLGYDGTKLTTNGLTVNGNILAPNAGNFVAIGTADALGAGTDRLALLGSSTDSGVRIWASSSTHKGTSVPLQVADYSGTELFRVHGDGNVGIGSTIPGSKLDVNGGIKATTATFTNLTGGNAIVWNTGSGLLDDSANLSYTQGTSTINVVNIDSSGHAELDDVNISGVSTFVGFSTFKDGAAFSASAGDFGVDFYIPAWFKNNTPLYFGGTPHNEGGNGGDSHLQINGNSDGNSYISVGGNSNPNTDSLTIRSNNLRVEEQISGHPRLVTVTAGAGVTIGGNVEVSGILTASSFSGGGISTSGTSEFTNLNVSGLSTFSGIHVQDDSGNNDVIIDNNYVSNHVYISLKDNCKAQFGNGTDLQIWHDASDSYVLDQGVGNLILGANDAVRITNGAGTENKIVATTDGSVELYYDNVKKFETTSSGSIVTGILTATSFIGDGSGLVGVAKSTILEDAGISTSGTTTLNHLSVSGVSTFSNAINLYDVQRMNFHDTNSAIYGNTNGLQIISAGTKHIYINSNDAGGVLGDVIFQSEDTTTAIIKGTGNVGIGTTNPDVAVTSANTKKLSVGIVSAYQLYGDGSNLTNVGSAATDAWIDDAQYNLAAGTGAGANRAAAAEKNIFIGPSAGCKLNSGDANVFLGWNAGYYTATGDQNFYGGYATGVCNQSGDRNVAIGSRALRGSGTPANNTGGCNIALGRDAGLSVTSGADNIALGRVSLGGANVTGSYNIAFGHQSGCAVTSAGCNIILGLKAGKSITAAGNNIFMGCYAGANLDGATVSTNIMIGEHAGKGTAGCSGISNNIFIGRYTGTNIQTASYNVAVGRQAGKCLTTPIFNAFFGNYAGCRVTTGGCNTFIGNKAGGGSSDITGGFNVGIGYNVEVPDATGSTQLVIGCSASHWIVGNSDFNVGIGTDYPNAAVGVGNTAKLSVGIVSAYMLYGCGANLTGLAGFSPDDQGNLYAGTDAGAASDADTLNNIAIGQGAGKSLNAGDCNVLIGFCAGEAATQSSKLIAIGRYAGRCSMLYPTGFSNVFIGDAAGQKFCRGQGNVAIGHEALFGGLTYQEEVDYSIFIGQYAGCSVCRGADAIWMGCKVGAGVTDAGSGNIWLGNEAGGGSGTDVGNNNVFIGASAGKDITTGNMNTFIGAFAGLNIESGGYNSAYGRGAGQLLTTGSSNTFLGRYAGCMITTGSSNVVIGKCAGCNKLDATTGEQIAIGVGDRVHLWGECKSFGVFETTIAGIATVYNNTGIVSATKFCGDGSALTGISAGGFTPDADENLVAGTNAGEDLDGTNACWNILIGCGAGKEVTCGNSNVYLGRNVGLGNTGGNCSILIGTAAGKTGVVVCNNIIIGNEAGHAGTLTGVKNVMLGNQTGCQVTSGDYNTLLGHCAGTNLTTANDSVMIGRGAGQTGTTTGNENVFIGKYAGKAAASAYNNVAIGKETGCSLDSGAYNTFIGDSVGRSHTTGNYNIISGYYAGNSQTSANCNIKLGYQAGRKGNGADNIILGTGAGCETTANCGILIGAYAGHCMCNGNSNIAIGSKALCGSTTVADNTGKYNISFGPSSGNKITSGQYNLFFGNFAGGNVTSGQCNVYLGRGAGGAAGSGGTGHSNIAIGCYAGGHVASGAYNIMYGRGAGKCHNGSHNIAIGQEALCGSSTVGDNTGACNIALGMYAGKVITTGYNNVLMGKCAGKVLVTGYDNVLIGAESGGALTGGSGEGFFNVMIGAGAGKGTVDGYGNVILGRCAGELGDFTTYNFFGGYGAGKNATGGENTFVGACAGDNSTSGSNNVAIGYRAEVVSATGTNQLAIGINANRWITGDSSWNITVNDIAATNFNSTSDIRLKTNIKRIEDPLAKVIQIEGVTFDWKEYNKPALGVIADQVEEVIPELVQGTDPKTVNYNGLIGLLIEAVKEQQTQIDDLKSRLSKLE